MHHAFSASLPLPLAKHIVFRAFLLSQGHTAIQTHLFGYIALTHPDWLLPDEKLDHLISEVVMAFNRFFARGWHPPIENFTARMLEEEVSEAVLALQYVLNRTTVDKEMLLSTLWVEIVRRDHHFLVLQPGRARERFHHEAHSPAARYFSHLCQYGLLHVPIGLPEFDQLFREVGFALQERTAIFRRGMAQPEAPAQLAQVIIVHNLYYPDALVTLTL